MAQKQKPKIGDFIENAFARTVLGTALLLPYGLRVRLVGWVMSRLVAPFAGWNKRVGDNLALTMPELPEAEVQRIMRRVTNNVGRTLIEIYSGDEFIARTKSSPLTGPGVDALEANKGKPAVLVTAHMGNYDAVRGKLSRSGYPMGALYRPMKNPSFHEHYLKAISRIATPVFPTDSRGIAGMIKMLKNGGNIGIVFNIGGDIQASLKQVAQQCIALPLMDKFEGLFLQKTINVNTRCLNQSKSKMNHLHISQYPDRG